MALGLALVLMTACEVDELVLVVAQGNADLQPVDHIAAGADVGQRMADAQGSADHGFDLGGQRQTGVHVVRGHDQPTAVDRRGVIQDESG